MKILSFYNVKKLIFYKRNFDKPWSLIYYKPKNALILLI